MQRLYFKSMKARRSSEIEGEEKINRPTIRRGYTEIEQEQGKRE